MVLPLHWDLELRKRFLPQKILPQGEVTVPTKNGRNLLPEFGLVDPLRLRYTHIDRNWAIPSECDVLKVFQCQFCGISENLLLAESEFLFS